MQTRNLILSIVLLVTPLAYAVGNCSPDSLSLGCILGRQIYQMTYVVQFIVALAFVSGWGFIIAAIFKFKQVRENPQQVPVSTPFAFLLTAILLIFLPGFIRFGGQTLFVGQFDSVSDLSGAKLGTTNLSFLSVENINVTPGRETSLGNDTTVYGMVRRTTDMFPTLTIVIINCAYIAGLGFAVAGLFKMKAVRDNPQQNTIAAPISYLIVAILLMYMPDIIKPTSQTLFGDSASATTEGGGAGQNFTTILTSSSTS